LRRSQRFLYVAATVAWSHDQRADQKNADHSRQDQKDFLQPFDLRSAKMEHADLGQFVLGEHVGYLISPRKQAYGSYRQNGSPAKNRRNFMKETLDFEVESCYILNYRILPAPTFPDERIRSSGKVGLRSAHGESLALWQAETSKGAVVPPGGRFGSPARATARSPSNLARQFSR
jgi:hypothetical protein